MTDVADVVFVVDAEVVLVVFTDVADVVEPPELDPEQEKTSGPGIV